MTNATAPMRTGSLSLCKPAPASRTRAGKHIVRKRDKNSGLTDEASSSSPIGNNNQTAISRRLKFSLSPLDDGRRDEISAHPVAAANANSGHSPPWPAKSVSEPYSVLNLS